MGSGWLHFHCGDLISQPLPPSSSLESDGGGVAVVPRPRAVPSYLPRVAWPIGAIQGTVKLIRLSTLMHRRQGMRLDICRSGPWSRSGSRLIPEAL